MKNIVKISACFVLSLMISLPCFAAGEGLEGLYVASCNDLEVIFARGSGAPLDISEEFLAVANAAQRITNEFYLGTHTIDLPYPAVSVGDNIPRLIGAYVSAGKSYEFGASVATGVNNLKSYYVEKRNECPDSDYILVGYSQGAMVIAQSLSVFDPEHVKFIMLIGDPKTYLPEGEGLFPEACNGGALSPYRTYAPNCRTYEGAFGGRKPYELSGLVGKYSLWCNREDYVCGGSKNPLRNSGHMEYVDKIGWGMQYLALRYLEKYKPSDIRPLSLRSAPLDNYLEDNSLVNDAGGADIDAPDASVWRDGDVLKMEWLAPSEAKYMLLKFNGIDLGYIDANLGKFEIRDVDFSDEYDLSLAWMNASGELGTIAHAEPEIEPRTIAEISNDEPSENTPIAPMSEVSAVPMDEMTVDAIEESATSSGIAALPAKIAKKNGLSFADKTQIVTTVISVMGAGGLLTIFVIRKRRG